MEINTHSCDICGVLKKEANHWFKGYVLADKDNARGVAIFPWDSNFGAPRAHLCGLTHAVQWEAKELEKAGGSNESTTI